MCGTHFSSAPLPVLHSPVHTPSGSGCPSRYCTASTNAVFLYFAIFFYFSLPHSLQCSLPLRSSRNFSIAAVSLSPSYCVRCLLVRQASTSHCASLITASSAVVV